MLRIDTHPSSVDPLGRLYLSYRQAAGLYTNLPDDALDTTSLHRADWSALIGTMEDGEPVTEPYAQVG